MTGDELLAAYREGKRDFRGANLGDADLRAADLGEQWIIQGAIRSDGYQFMLTNFNGEGIRLKAGCRKFTMIEAYAHWIKTRGGTKLGDETIAILDNLWQIAWIRGYLDSDGKWIGELK